MSDIIDQAQENDELFRRVSLEKHFARHTPGSAASGNAVKIIDCADCNEPIPAKRLKANPQATRCVECQTLAEKRGFEDE
ncbi:MAG: TraR/DksA family transcriptional regulator [Victivallales bacterium]|jgi:DnaK suppressor protein